MILVFGGTTEGKQAAAVLNELQLPYWYSTKTEIEWPTTDHGKYRFGAMDVAQLKTVIAEVSIQCIIDAAHPFATQLHQMIQEVAEELALPVYRFVRRYPDRSEHPLVHYVSGYDEALQKLATIAPQRLLALTGVQSIARLKSYWERHQSYFRILDRASSIAEARASNFPSACPIKRLRTKKNYCND